MHYAIVFVQVASSEWFLTFQIQYFENLYNAEIRNNEYCCCDNPDDPCGNDINAVDSMTCMQYRRNVSSLVCARCKFARFSFYTHDLFSS